MLRARTRSGYVGQCRRHRSLPASIRRRRISSTRQAAIRWGCRLLAHGPYPAQEHHQEIRQPHRAEGARPRDRRRRVLRPARRDRRRQDDDAAPHRRAGKADRGPDPHRRRRCRRLGRGRARRGAGAAAILALSALHGARESRIPAEVEDPPRRPGRDRRARRARRQDAAHRAPARPQDRPAVRRRDAARLDRPRHRAQAARLPDGRAAVGARRQAARGAAHRAQEPADESRRDLPVRHPRPDRGDVDGRQDRRAQRRPPGADRHAARDLQQPAQHLRRPLGRLAADEPARRRAA